MKLYKDHTKGPYSLLVKNEPVTIKKQKQLIKL